MHLNISSTKWLPVCLGLNAKETPIWLKVATTQLPMGEIDQSHKSHNAPVPYPTIHHFVIEMCTFQLQTGALWDILAHFCYKVLHCGIFCLMHYGICETDLSAFVVIMHLACANNAANREALGLQLLFVRALVHWQNPPQRAFNILRPETK